MFDLLRRLMARQFGRRPVDRAAHGLYVSAVEAARSPALFTKGQVADTLDGRFDMIALHLTLVMDRLAHASDNKGDQVAALETRLMEVHFSDMDQALREMGVGDLSVGKKVKAMARAFMGRRQAYTSAFETLDADGDEAPLRDALVRNVYRGAPPAPGAVDWLVAYCRRQRKTLKDQDIESVAKGQVRFTQCVPGKVS
ncbi:MAG: ubiquinol-cytochrome C chaperone [Alphaproteobacteria bacterium]|nr:MAG: ubiquinol-cytochrome C chaperone [Alphaproteobacteria bacterium]